MTAIPDLAQRRRALDPTRSFIVQAPAGSGKTELLIQRFLALLARVERPEEIAAITFTRKAAAEMRRRILEALAAARRAPRPAAGHHADTWDLARAALERNDARGWRLEESAARLRVQTIDALCAALTRQMPVLSRFGAQPESIDDAAALYLEAARNALAALEDPADPDAARVERLLAHLDNDVGRAAELIAGMLPHRDHWIRSLAAGERAALEATLRALRAAGVRRAARQVPPGCGLSLPPEDDVEAWQALAARLLTRDGSWRRRPPVPPALACEEPLRLALGAVRQLPPAAYSEAQWQALEAITGLLRRAAAELKLAFARAGQADFVEIAQGALRALHGDDGPTDLMLALDYRLRHLLVDEFQDTSFTQRDLLRLLTAGWEPGDGRTLFVVGDPMQSIYRFREAEVALFLEAQREGIGAVPLEPLTLSANFRSQAGIVDWVNAAFPRILPAEDDVIAGAVKYAPSAAVQPALPHAVRVHPFFDGDREGEARAVAAIAAEALARDASVAILVRSRKHLAQVVPGLRAAGLAFRAIEIEPLGHRPVVRDLLALTRALLHLADRTAWLAVLRAPWTGATLAELEAAAARAGATLWEALADAGGRLARLREALAPFVAARGRRGLRERVEGAWLALGGPACIEAATDLEDAEAYLDHLEEAEDAGGLPDLAAFERGVAKLYALPDAAATERLQVMTIHKAKGLEFDTVILPGLGAGTAHDERRLFLWVQSTAGLLVAPVNPTGSDRDPIYECIRALDHDKAGHECGRLLYVAATRARRELHLLGDCRREAGALREPPAGSLLARLWPVVGSRFVAAAADAAAPPPAATAAPPAVLLRRLAQPPRYAVPAPLAWDAPAEKPRREDAIEFSWAGQTARSVGSVVHRWLQRIADDGLAGWNAARIAALRPALRQELAARGVSEAEIDAATARSAAALAAAIADPRGRWALGPQRAARTEYRVTAVIDGELRTLAIDRMFTDAEGRTWIVDYKTSSHEGGDLERFLGREQERYREQLERYARVTAGGDAMLGLYFPLLGGWREWPAAAPATPRRAPATAARPSP